MATADESTFDFESSFKKMNPILHDFFGGPEYHENNGYREMHDLMLNKGYDEKDFQKVFDNISTYLDATAEKNIKAGNVLTFDNLSSIGADKIYDVYDALDYGSLEGGGEPNRTSKFFAGTKKHDDLFGGTIMTDDGETISGKKGQSLADIYKEAGIYEAPSIDDITPPELNPPPETTQQPTPEQKPTPEQTSPETTTKPESTSGTNPSPESTTTSGADTTSTKGGGSKGHQLNFENVDPRIEKHWNNLGMSSLLEKTEFSQEEIQGTLGGFQVALDGAKGAGGVTGNRAFRYVHEKMNDYADILEKHGNLEKIDKDTLNKDLSKVFGAGELREAYKNVKDKDNPTPEESKKLEEALRKDGEKFKADLKATDINKTKFDIGIESLDYESPERVDRIKGRMSHLDSEEGFRKVNKNHAQKKFKEQYGNIRSEVAESWGEKLKNRGKFKRFMSGLRDKFDFTNDDLGVRITANGDDKLGVDRVRVQKKVSQEAAQKLVDDYGLDLPSRKRSGVFGRIANKVLGQKEYTAEELEKAYIKTANKQIQGLIDTGGISASAIGRLTKNGLMTQEKYQKMLELGEKHAKRRGYTPEVSANEAAAAKKGKLGWKGKAAVGAGVLALGAIILNQFNGGHQSNSQLYNPNPQPQYYS